MQKTKASRHDVNLNSYIIYFSYSNSLYIIKLIEEHTFVSLFKLKQKSHFYHGIFKLSLN